VPSSPCVLRAGAARRASRGDGSVACDRRLAGVPADSYRGARGWLPGAMACWACGCWAGSGRGPCSAPHPRRPPASHDRRASTGSCRGVVGGTHRQMISRQPLPNIRRQQEHLLTGTLNEALPDLDRQEILERAPDRHRLTGAAPTPGIHVSPSSGVNPETHVSATERAVRSLQASAMSPRTRWSTFGCRRLSSAPQERTSPFLDDAGGARSSRLSVTAGRRQPLGASMVPR